MSAPTKTPFITAPCLFCNRTSTVDLPVDVAEALRERTIPIQDLLPDTSPEQRELLISGIHPDCWTRNFG